MAVFSRGAKEGLNGPSCLNYLTMALSKGEKPDRACEVFFRAVHLNPIASFKEIGRRSAVTVKDIDQLNRLYSSREANGQITVHYEAGQDGASNTVGAPMILSRNGCLQEKVCL